MMSKKGQEGVLKNLVFAFILIGLFGFLILTAVVSVGDDYGKDTSEVVGGSLNAQLFNDSINNIESTTSGIKDAFEAGSVWGALGDIVTGLTGIFDVAKSIGAMILFPFQLVSNIMVDVLHIPSIITSVLMGLLLIGIIFAIWQFIKIGN